MNKIKYAFILVLFLEKETRVKAFIYEDQNVDILELLFFKMKYIITNTK